MPSDTPTRPSLDPEPQPTAPAVAAKARTRIFVPGPLTVGCDVAVPAEAVHHLRAVLRARPGDRVRLFNAESGEVLGVLTGIGKTTASARIDAALRGPRGGGGPDLWLAFAPIKKTAMDVLVEKAVELGVTRLMPILTRYTDSQRVRTDRLAAQTAGAVAQSERLDLVPLAEPVVLDRLLTDWPDDRPLLAAVESGPAIPLVDAAAALPRPLRAGLLIGPEGGFAPSEVDLLHRARKVRCVGLGPRVLRAETAALAACAILQAVAGDLADRPPHRE